jgi:hypothetical protein
MMSALTIRFVNRPNMSRLRHYLRRKTLLHRWPAKLVLLGYVWMCCGGTLPATLLLSSETVKTVAGKDRTVPFPCMDKSCGCRNAEHCFKSCCCSSKAERIAWAKEHHVSEEYMALAAGAEEKPVATKSCCTNKPTSSCCQPVKKTASCCVKSFKPKQPSEQQPEPSRSKQRPVPGLSMLEAMKCSGLQVGAFGVPLSLPLSPELPLLLEAPLLGVVAMDTPIFSSPVDTPDGPPPRL